MKKKLWSIGLLTALLLGIGAWIYSTRKTPMFRGEELLPSQTVAFIDASNIRAARQKFKDTALAKILAEPEVKDFLEGASHVGRNSKTMGETGTLLREALKLLNTAEGEAFVAITDVSISPKLQCGILAGFDPGSRSRQAEQALESLASQYCAQFPAAEMEDRVFESVPYKVWGPDRRTKIAFARLANFLLFSYGEEPLKEAIARSRGSTQDRLADAPVFASHRARMSGADVAVFVNPQAALGRFQTLLAFQPALKGSLASVLAIQSFAGTFTFKNNGIEGHSWTAIPSSRHAELGLSDFKRCERATMRAAGSDALLYGAMSLDIPRWFDRTTGELKKGGVTSIAAPIRGILKFMESRQIRLRDDLLGRFGPEAAVLLEWREPSRYPFLSLIVETKNPDQVRAVVERIFRFVQDEERGRITGLSVSTGPSNTKILSLNLAGWSVGLSPSFAVAEQFAILSVNRGSVESVLGNLSGAREGLAANKEFQAMDARFPRDYYQFVYCDQRHLFERVFGELGQLTASPFFSRIRAHVDFSRLPRAETISRHLFSSGWVASVDADGFHQSSFGPVNLPMLTLGAAGSVIGADPKK
ncbi:MAG: hypothetical protein HY360_19020 [Verrucomicrobia bacterium]|nr:hypothetical protein [Verrucomicrobiota bacterium]